MAKFKTFGKLEKNDVIFSAQIKDSHLYQNCIGKIFDRYLITDKIVNEKGDTIITVIYDKSTLMKSWKPSDADATIVFKVDDDKELTYFNTTGKEVSLPNVFLFATNIEALRNKIKQIIDEESIKLGEEKKILDEKEANLSNIKINFRMRMNFNPEYEEANIIPEYQETVITEEVYV